MNTCESKRILKYHKKLKYYTNTSFILEWQKILSNAKSQNYNLNVNEDFVNF